MEEHIKILLVEDNPADSRLIEIFLKVSYGPNFSLITAPKLSDCLSILDNETFDIIIVDLTLPDSRGLDTFIDIQQKASHTPIMVLTGVEDEEIGISAMKLGAQDFLMKGKLHNVELKRSINYSIERYKLLSELSQYTGKLKEKSDDLLREQLKLAEAQKLAKIGSWELNLADRSISWSDELYRIFGIEPLKFKITYRKFLEFVHEEDRIYTENIIAESFRVLKSFDFIFRIVRPDNSVRTLHTKSEIICDQDGKPIRILGTSQDVTDRFHEQELEKLVLAATKSYNSVIISNSSGKIEWVNEGFTKLTGYTLEEVINTFGEVLRKGEIDCIVEQQNIFEHILKQRKPLTYECKNYSKFGKEYWIITTVTPVFGKNGEVERIIAIDTDITLRKKMEEELKQANRIAEHSLIKGGKALNELMEAKSQLEESLKVKEQFLANMSHEIRTPMNAIIGFTNLILKADLNEENKQFVNAIKTSGENLLVIINDILDFSKLESGKINFEKIDFSLPPLINTLMELMLPRANEKKINLVSSIDNNVPLNLIGDPTRLNQILINLTGNAIKFTSKGEVKITVTLVTEDEQNAELEFSVIDTGIGIKEDKLSEIFESFTQGANDTARKFGGTGLGLTISKQLVENQGGSISVKSKINEGSCFSFRLKFRKSNKSHKSTDPRIQSNEDSEMNLEGVRVLLVEDNLMNQLLAKKILKNWKCIVELAENGLVAVEKASHNDFDIILMDIQMPEMDGYEATTRIRSLPDIKRNVSIIAMTAHAISGEAEKCISLGMDDYISKPFDENNLYNKITGLINKNKLK